MRTMEFTHTGRCRLIADGLRLAGEGLALHEEAVNRLNVFPVPDGDTGTNMLRTLKGAIAEATSADCESLVARVSKAALLGARGNSGVILSQIIHALVLAVYAEPELESGWLSGLKTAAKAAREAILSPQAGTMLTVIEAASDGTSILSSLSLARVALEHTPEQLEVLRRAGVVDSGGAGLVIVLEAMAQAMGEALPEHGDYPWLVAAASVPQASIPDLSGAELTEHNTAEIMGYEVMFSLEASAVSMDAMRILWSGIGDSIVVVGNGGIYRCHIHTNSIGEAIEAGIEAGRVSGISVTDLREQVAEAAWVVSAGTGGTEAQRSQRSQRPQRTAVVAVASGEGLSRLFRSFGVTSIVVGGQSYNPSTAEILEAVEGEVAQGVIVLPNNSNVQATAQAALTLYGGRAAIIPTVHVIEGFSALMAFDPGSDLETNTRRMADSARHVRWGEVTNAVRSGTFPGGAFGAGSFIGLSAAGIASASSELGEALWRLIESLVDPESEILTLIEGESADRAVSVVVRDRCAAAFEGLSIEILSGGQPLYPYLVGVE